MSKAISTRSYRHICQSCYPWNVKFSEQLTERAFDARPAVADKDAQTLARDLLQMSQAEFNAAFENSPMKRAELRGLTRNAAAVLGNVGNVDDIDILARTLDAEEALVCEHAAWAIASIRAELQSVPTDFTGPLISDGE